MRKIMIDKSISDFSKMIKNRTVLCIIVGISALILNLVFTIARTDSNHTVMLILNIATDIITGFFITYFASFYILPQKKCLKFSSSAVEIIYGSISNISEKTIRVLGFDCYTVEIDSRKVFLPDCSTVTFKKGENVTLGIVMNIVTEAEK